MDGDPVLPPAGHIPVDYKISKSKGRLGLKGGDLTVRDAEGNLAYRIHGGSVRTLFDAADAPLITAVQHDDGWQGFRGNSSEDKDLIFTVKNTLCSPLKSELEVFLSDESIENLKSRSSFKLKGSPFHRSCTIYSGDSIIAQTSLLYKLRKIIYSRNKFRLTVYPGIDHALVIAMLMIFFGGS